MQARASENDAPIEKCSRCFFAPLPSLPEMKASPSSERCMKPPDFALLGAWSLEREPVPVERAGVG